MVKVNARQDDLRGDQHNNNPFQLVALLVVQDLEEKLGVALDVRDLVLDLAESEGGKEERDVSICAKTRIRK
jgi:hypothetical protein